MIKHFLHIIFIFSSFLLITSCAQISPPTGGPRDTIPPIRIFTLPEHKSINFHGKTIQMEYDERIKTDKLKEQLIITPLIEFDYEFLIKKNIFKITFEEPFQDSITYSLNFRESIQDITENNPTKDNKFTFSTGNFIDSMSVTGYVKELLTYDTLKNIIIGLYKAEDTITIFNGSPYYFTEITEEGSFLIENIKNGEYLLYAFSDENKNLKLETNKEIYGFVKDTLLLDSGIFHQNIDLINLDLTDFRRVSAVISGKNYDVNFNKFITGYTLNFLDTGNSIYTNLSKENKTIRFYNTPLELDSIQVAYTAIDSINTQISDTLYVKFSESKRKQEELTIKISPSTSSIIEEQVDVKIEFNKPILSINTDSMFVQFDTTRILSIHDSIFQWNTQRDVLNFSIFIDRSLADTVLNRRTRIAQIKTDSIKTVQNEIQEKQQITKNKKTETKKINKGLQLYFGKGSFLSVEHDTSSILAANYKLLIPAEHGTQLINVTSEYNMFRIQLLSEKFEVIKESTNSYNVEFKNVKPGKYKVRVLIDENEDGEWSPGNMKMRIEPEPVYIYPDILVIRADWQTSLDLTF